MEIIEAHLVDVGIIRDRLDRNFTHTVFANARSLSISSTTNTNLLLVQISEFGTEDPWTIEEKR